jgi:hypothetical protein
MSDEWFIERKTGLAGPYADAKLRALAAQGKIAPTDVIRKGANGKPLSASEFVGLFAPNNSSPKLSRTPPPLPAQLSPGVDLSDLNSNSTEYRAPRSFPPPLPGASERIAPSKSAAKIEQPREPLTPIDKQALHLNKPPRPSPSLELVSGKRRPARTTHLSPSKAAVAGCVVVVGALLLGYIVVASRKRPKPDEYMLNGSSVLASLQERIAKDNQKIDMEFKHGGGQERGDKRKQDNRQRKPAEADEKPTPVPAVGLGPVAQEPKRQVTSKPQAPSEDGRGPTPDPEVIQGRELRVVAPSLTPAQRLTIGTITSSLKRITCHATASGELIIAFDVDTNSWPNLPMLFPMVVRLFDRNGHYLTHFTTREGFTVHDSVYKRFSNWAGWTKPIKLLKQTDNRLMYSVNMRDLRDAQIIEIRFADAQSVR